MFRKESALKGEGKETIYVVELRKVRGDRAETLLVTAHPEVLRAVLEAWERILPQWDLSLQKSEGGTNER